MPKLINRLTIMPVYNDGREVSTEIFFPSIPDKIAIIKTPAKKGERPSILYYGEPAEVFIWLNSYLCFSQDDNRIDSDGVFRWEKYFTSGKVKDDYELGVGCGIA